MQDDMKFAASACEALADSLDSIRRRLADGTLSPEENAEALSVVCENLRDLAQALNKAG